MIVVGTRWTVPHYQSEKSISCATLTRPSPYQVDSATQPIREMEARDRYQEKDKNMGILGDTHVLDARWSA